MNIRNEEKQIRTIYKETEYFDIDENIYTFFTQSSLTENLHSHEFWEISYVYGNRALSVTAKGTEEINPGEFIMISPGARHAIRSMSSASTERARVCNLLIRAKYMRQLIEKYADYTSLSDCELYKKIIHGESFCLHFIDEDNLSVKQLLWQIKSEFEHQELAYEDVVTNSILSLLIFVTRLSKPKQNGRVMQNDFDRLKKYIKVNYGMALSLELLASEMGFSREYLSRCFKKEYGINVSEYIAHIRIEKAKEMLKQTDDSIEVISENVGFNTISAFQKAFKKEVGFSPRKYRKNSNVKF